MPIVEEALPESCNVTDEDDIDSKVGSSEFVGNTVLVLGMLLGIFIVHVFVVSAVEAYWMAEVWSLNWNN